MHNFIILHTKGIIYIYEECIDYAIILNSMGYWIFMILCGIIPRPNNSQYQDLGDNYVHNGTRPFLENVRDLENYIYGIVTGQEYLLCLYGRVDKMCLSSFLTCLWQWLTLYPLEALSASMITVEWIQPTPHSIIIYF